jgi:hypothetical protein
MLKLTIESPTRALLGEAMHAREQASVGVRNRAAPSGRFQAARQTVLRMAEDDGGKRRAAPWQRLQAARQTARHMVAADGLAIRTAGAIKRMRDV